MSKPILTLSVKGQNLQMPLSRALWAAWRILTYPLTILAAYYFFGTDGLFFMACVLVLQNRGQL